MTGEDMTDQRVPNQLQNGGLYTLLSLLAARSRFRHRTPHLFLARHSKTDPASILEEHQAC